MRYRPFFWDRADAGRQLAHRLASPAATPKPLILALPRGGVPVAYEVAREVGADLDILLVRKLGVPGQEELAMGAIASDGAQVIDDLIVRHFNVSREVLRATIERES